MIFTTLVVFVGCSIWTITYSFTKSKLLPVKLFTMPVEFQFPLSLFNRSEEGFLTWVGFDYQWNGFFSADQYKIPGGVRSI